MKSIIYTILFSLTYIFQLSGQSEGHNIEISSTNYDKQNVVIGYYLADRQLVLDTLLKNDNDKFIMKGDTSLDEGVYLLLLTPNNKYIQFIINKNEQNFQIELDTTNLGNPTITGSLDNKLFLDYINFISEKGKENQLIIQEINVKSANGEDVTALKQKQKGLDSEVKTYQRNLEKKYPEYITPIIVNSTRDVEIPEFEGDLEEVKSMQYFYYKKHYFDNIDLANPTSIRTPFFHNKIDTYLNKLTPQNPDSINTAIDMILGKMKPAEFTYKFYLSHFLNTYAKSKIVGFDAIYVHLVDNYYAKGEADWVDQENLNNIVGEANKIRPTLIGKAVQDIKVYRKDKSAISISDIKSKYLMLYFWAPDCGHCKKATPFVIDFYKKYKDTLGIDLEILAVCTKHRDKEPSCWETIDEKGMNLWINASDVNHLSRFRTKFNVETTPAVFILNEEREIIMKRVGAEYLDEVMQEIIRLDDLKAMEEQMEKE